jgi:hypothetical protein
MSCDDSFPVFLLYHKGKLTGFGWAVIADLNTTSRVEHPTPSELGVSLCKGLYYLITLPLQMTFVRSVTLFT